ncbi:hypothetical protein [Hymenobacter sediminicola]|uniref:Uncharacterized protein n=1 Tax=Hymenobacter sediminicola TaxID=2761579 RepID=A0A7G7WAD9_9BACT|nr:hypothetical protein [Hymenobacter sediminicola]QNH63332.1 hypothetical protein H4317_05880 [Hymenobacter sediminicola]
MPIRSLTSRQLFIVLLYATCGFYGPVSLFLGLLSLADVVPARLNEQEYYGLKGFVIYLLFAPFVIFILTVSIWIFVAPGWKLARIVLDKFSPVSKLVSE